jgi:hypothetical protein
VAVDRFKLGREIRLKISRDKTVRIRTKAFAEEVKEYWQNVAWPESGFTNPPKAGPGHPYSTGDYKDSIKIRQGRSRLGRFLATFKVYTDHENANFIEYGTGPDKPGSRSPWGPNTPTPEFAPAAKTAHHFKGTAP